MVDSDVKWSAAECVPDRALFTLRTLLSRQFLLWKRTAPLCCGKWNVPYRKQYESSLNTYIGAEIATEPRIGNCDLFKSIGSIADCMTDRDSVHTGNATGQFLHCNRTLIFVHTARKQLLKWRKTYPVECELSLRSLLK